MSKIHKEKQFRKKIIIIDSLNQNQLPLLYKNAKAFLFPTKYDIFGMVLMEAMFFEVPVVSSYNGGSSTIISNSKNGFICSYSVDDWVKATQVLLNDSNLASTIGKQAKQTVLEYYNWDAIVCKVLTIIEDVVYDKGFKN